MNNNRLIKLFGFLLLFFVGLAVEVNATSNNMLYTTSSLVINDSKEFSFKVYVKTNNTISGAVIPWNFDTDKLNLVSITSKNFNLTYRDQHERLTSNIVLDSTKDFTGEIELFEIKFEVTSNFKDNDSASINFGFGQIANYRKSYKITGVSFKVNKGLNNSINIESNEIPISTDSPNETSSSNYLTPTKLAANEENKNDGLPNDEAANKNNGNIEAINTGSIVPYISIFLLCCCFVGFKSLTRKASLFYKI